MIPWGNDFNTLNLSREGIKRVEKKEKGVKRDENEGSRRKRRKEYKRDETLNYGMQKKNIIL